MVPQIAPLARSVIDRSPHRDHAAVIPKEEAVRGAGPDGFGESAQVRVNALLR
jgi:hypothetical protein